MAEHRPYLPWGAGSLLYYSVQSWVMPFLSACSVCLLLCLLRLTTLT